MRNAWRLFIGDLKRLRANVMTVIAIIGLIALPSIFSWYNMLACWNVFDNTGNLTIAVANSDEGYQSDLVALRVNIGDQVEKALRENNQLNWTFTNEEDAVDGTRSGRYYAAVVIPPSFSRDMMSFYSSDVEHANIVYYSNEKKNAIAPKVTDQGADQIARQINQTFAETLSEIALSIATSLMQYYDDADMKGFAGTVSEHLAEVGNAMSDSASALALYSSLISTASNIVADAGSLLADARAASDEAIATAREAQDATSAVPEAITATTDALSIAIGTCANSYAGLPASITSLLDTATTMSSDASSQLRSGAEDINALIADCRSLATQLERADAALGGASGQLSSAITRLNNSIASQERLRASLLAAADSIDATSSVSQSDRAEINQIASDIAGDLAAMQADFDENLAPALAGLSDTMGDVGASLAFAGSELENTAGNMTGTTSSLTNRLDTARGKLDDAVNELAQSGEKISALATRFSEAALSGDLDSLRAIIGTDPKTLATAISAPIAIERHAVFPVENFGSAMSPLYTTLALWIGALLMMVTLKLTPSERVRSEFDNLTSRQIFVGRFGIIALLSLLQSTIIALGNLLFLGVQANDPLLYLVCFWISGLMFAAIIYTSVALFANAGKAIAVVLLIVQVSGGGGSFPMQLLPDFFQNVSPYLPITHAVNAMRAAMFGVYNGDFWIEIGTLTLFGLPLLVLGFVLVKPLSHVVPKFVERVEASKLM